MTDLEFRPLERHPYAYVATGFGLVLLAAAVAAFAASSTIAIVVGLFAVGFGGAILLSAAYAAWGRLHVLAGDDGWCTITWKLGPWSRTKRFPRADVRNVAHASSPAFTIMWPSSAGRYLRVELRRGAPIDVGGGFNLDDASLASIERLVTPK
jgi:hypothetical protein